MKRNVFALLAVLGLAAVPTFAAAHDTAANLQDRIAASAAQVLEQRQSADRYLVAAQQPTTVLRRYVAPSTANQTVTDTENDAVAAAMANNARADISDN